MSEIAPLQTKEKARIKVGFVFEKGLDFLSFLWYCCVLTGGTANEKYDKRAMARKYQSNPQEDSRNNSSEMKELMEYRARHHDDLLKTMTDERKEIFEKFDDCWSEYASYAEEAIFTYAFKLGMQIAIEALTE